MELLESKLKLISELEERHDVVGVSFAVKDGVTVLTEESADFVIAAIESGVKDFAEFDRLPTSRIAIKH